MRFKLRQMEVFRAVMITGSMSGAGRVLNITQPAVSRIVSYTEQSLGLRLFERIGTRLAPTTEASILMAAVETLYENALQVDDLARDLARRPGGTLTIAASPSLALHVIPTVIARFLKAHPQVHVRYHTTLLADMPRELTSRQASLAISVLPVEHPEIHSEILAQGEMVCLLPKDHPLAAGTGPLALAEIGRHPLVMYDRLIPFGRLIWRAFETAEIEPQIALEVPRAELAIAMVRAGIGLAIVDEFAATSGITDLPYRHIAEPLGMTLSLLLSRHEPPPGQNARIFIDLLRSHLKSRRD